MTPTGSRYLPDNKKIVIFGAGRIGRSFIGQLFSRAGFDVVFVDILGELIDALNRAGHYRLIMKDDKGESVLDVGPVRGVCLENTEEVIREISGARLAALCVGTEGLPRTFPSIAAALMKRGKQSGGPLDILVAENMRNADQYIYRELGAYLPREFPLMKMLGLVETSIGKMVPFMAPEDLEADPLQLFAEPFNTLIVAREGFRNPLPEVEDLEPKQNIKAWVDRKLFIHNLGHASAAYLGFRKNPGAVYIHEVLDDPEILDNVRSTMLQSADILMALHPGEFEPSQLSHHIDDLLDRFRNRALGDTVFRVGCDLYRKLNPEDRLVAPIRTALSLQKPYDLIAGVLLASLTFRATDKYGHFHHKDIPFFSELEGKGINHIIENICKLKPYEIIH